MTVQEGDYAIRHRKRVRFGGVEYEAVSLQLRYAYNQRQYSMELRDLRADRCRVWASLERVTPVD